MAKKHTKAQLKIQEMSFMLLAVVLFFVLVGLFAVTLIYNNLSKQANLLSQDKSRQGVNNIANVPEFMCGAEFANCMDADKLIAMSNRKGYDNFFPFSSLEVIKFSGLTKNETQLIECTKNNYPNCDIIRIYDKNANAETKASNFVALCRKDYENSYAYDRCEIAKAIAGSEIK